MQRDAPTRSGDDLRDAAAHLAGADDEYVLELHGAWSLPFARWTSDAATPSDAAAIERDPGCAAGRRPTGTSSRPRSSTAAVSIQADAGASASRAHRRAGRPSSPTTTARWSGFASVGPSRDEHGIGELYAIYVDPDRWSPGAGRALIERARSDCATAYAEATLWVLEDNPRARSFYEAPAGRSTAAARRTSAGASRAPEVRYRKRAGV